MRFQFYILSFLLPHLLTASPTYEVPSHLRSIKATEIIEVKILEKASLKRLVLEIRLSKKTHENLRNTFPNLIELQNDTFIFEKDRLIWGHSVTGNDLIGILKRTSAFLNRSQRLHMSHFWLNTACASNSNDCLLRNDPQQVAELNSQVNNMVISDFVKKCDYNFESLMAKKIDELKETWKKMEGATLEGFLIALKDGYKALKEILPQINSKIVLPLIDLQEKVPPLANKLACDFIEAKVGDVFISMGAGPVGIVRLMAKTSHDIAEFASKIYKFTQNGTASFFVVDLHRLGKLRPEHLDRLTNLQNDFPSEIKKIVTKRFHGFTNHGNMRAHLDKHRKEMGFRSDEDYLDAAHHFAKHVDKDNLVFVEPSGSIKKWNTKTDEYLVLDSKGKILTYYKQSCANHADKLLVLILTLDEKNKQGVCQQY